ncbi:MAG: class I SAM-dependent methyltransferase [Candidatus Coatesbacteria bacterium]
MTERDDPGREPALRALVRGKPALRHFYERIYAGFAERLRACPPGVALELGSGAGFLKDVLPEVVTSDVLPYAGVDRVVDAAALPFPDGGLRAIFLLNVFHHLPDAGAFLREARRCLAPGGRVIMVDEYPGWIGTFVYRYIHHEGFDPKAREWSFPSSGPISGANGALAWIVFQRDRARFETMVPELKLDRWRPIFPLGYWLAGGLKRWSLLPGRTHVVADWVDRQLLRISPKFGSFVEVELVKTGESA